MNTTEEPEEVDLSSQKSTSIIVISLMIAIVGLLGNSMVICVIMRTKHLKERLANLFIVNQSSIDFLSSGLLLFTVLPATKITRYEGWSGWLACSIWSSNSFLWGLVFSSTYSLIALTLERYLSVVYPVWHKVCFSRTKAYVVMLLTWVAGLVEGVAHSIPTSIIKDGLCFNFYHWPSLGMQKMAGVLTCTLHYIVPMVVLIYCYGKMILVISGRIERVGPNDGSPGQATAPVQPTGQEANDANLTEGNQARKSKGDSWSRARRNVIYTLSLISLLFALCWSMNQIYYLMMTLGYPPDYTSTFYNITVMAVHLNACVNPFIYITRYDQFKTSALMMFKCGSSSHNNVIAARAADCEQTRHSRIDSGM